MTPEILPIEDDPARERVRRYLDCLSRWAPKINLTGAECPDGFVATLVLPILGAEILLSGLVVDVGSGNGSPGLVLAALRPELDFVLLEPRAKRWAFLREAAREMGAGNVVVERQRSDTYKGTPANTVTMRAVGLDPARVRHLLRPSGQVLVFGGPPLKDTEAIRLAHGSTVQRRCFT